MRVSRGVLSCVHSDSGSWLLTVPGQLLKDSASFLSVEDLVFQQSLSVS